MRVHHLNCGTFCPRGGPAVLGRAPKMVCHCLLIETDSGLVLVDTGIGLQDVDTAGVVVHPAMRWLSRPALDPAETAWAQVQALGFKPTDVRHIIVTHLDADHAGGLADFPHAAIHLLGAEYAAATTPHRALAHPRYRSILWRHQPDWVCYEPQGESWFGFEAVRELKGLPAEILLIPLLGHTPGHAGVAVEQGDRWLLHAGDAYYVHEEVHGSPSACPPGMKLFGQLTQTDAAARAHNQQRLRQLVRRERDRVRVICSHDHGEWEACRARPLLPL